MNEHAILRGRAKFVSQKPPQRIEGHRVCSHPMCTTVLSVYNKDSMCHFHKPRKTIRIRGRTPSEIMDKESSVVHSCMDCINLTGSVFEEASKVLFDGTVHVQGVNGKGTLCEV